MHFHWMGDRPTADVARTAARMGADAVEVAHPDEAVNSRLVRDIKRAHPTLPRSSSAATPTTTTPRAASPSGRRLCRLVP